MSPLLLFLQVSLSSALALFQGSAFALAVVPVSVCYRHGTPHRARGRIEPQTTKRVRFSFGGRWGQSTDVGGSTCCTAGGLQFFLAARPQGCSPFFIVSWFHGFMPGKLMAGMTVAADR